MLKKYFHFGFIFLFVFTVSGQSDVSISVDITARTALLSNGIISMNIGSNGYVTSFKNNGKELIGSGKFYYDYTDSVSNKAFGPNAVRIQKQTSDYGEVVYSRTSGDLIMEQGFIIHKGVSGYYTYATVKGTANRIKLKEMRMVFRVDPNLFTYGYVSDRMQGQLPSVADMAAVNGTPVMDATYQLPDGTIYTKYDWSNYILEDSIHGIMSANNGLWAIPVSHEYVNGGPMKQELTVHTTNTTPLFMQMIQGEHFGAAAQYYNEGEQKLYGPFFIYANSGSSYAEMIEDAKNQVPVQKAQWPFLWFEHPLYTTDRSRVQGSIDISPGLVKDSIMVVLAQPGADIFDQGKGYIFWGLTDQDGNFSIEQVRTGTYSLYAYACKGEVTEILTVHNQVVAGANTSLGSLKWRPVKYQHLLWLIGENDRRSTGFHYSDTLRRYGLYTLPAANLTYTVGSSIPSRDWYYAQTKTGTWNVSFNCPQIYSGNAVLTASIAGAATTPSVDVYVNGTKKTTWSFINDGSVYRSAVLSGKHTVKTYTFPASLLRVGANTIGLKMTSVGSRGGVMYDCVKLEAGGLYTGIPTTGLRAELQSHMSPNPFNLSTTLHLDSPESGNIHISIFDITGREVECLYNGFINQGVHEFQWNPARKVPGIYMYRIELNNKFSSGRVILTK